MRKRKQRIEPPIQKVLISLSPRYYPNLPLSLTEHLPPPKSVQPLMASYFIYQEQADSGDYIIYTRTRWRPSRGAMTIFTDNTTDLTQPIVIFAVLPENDYEHFDEKFGFDIEWSKIIECQWRIISNFIVAACNRTLDGFGASQTGEEGEFVGFDGDLTWIHPKARKRIQKRGKRRLETFFQFPKTQHWQKLRNNIMKNG